MIEYKCKYCGKAFSICESDAKRGRGKFCSRDCYLKSLPKKIECVCKICGKDFKVLPCNIKVGHDNYCSVECFHKSQRNKVLRTCEYCGEEFYARADLVKMGRGRFCSKRCWSNSQKNQVECICQQCGKIFYDCPWNINNGGRKFCSQECSRKYHMDRVERICLHCGKEFEIRKTVVEKHGGGKYCSTECRMKHHVRENSPSWKGGISFGKYCYKFNNKFKERVRKFFRRKCIECGKTEKENGRKLDVHHVNYDKMVCCNDVRPLFAAVCRSCNAKANKDREFWENHYTEIIKTKYNGKCYFTKEETSDF